MTTGHFGPLELGDLETPEKRGKFINIEAIDAYIETARIDDATINDATIDSATITNADIDALSFDRITSGTNTNTLTVDGDLVLDTNALFATATSGARIEIDNSALGAERMTLYTGATGEYGAAYIETTDLDPIDAATMYVRGPDLGGATNGGYGEFTITSSDALSKSQFDLRAYAIGTWAADTDISAVAAGSGNPSVDLLASANTGDASISLTAGSNSGSADITLSADQISIPDGSAAAPALTNSGNTNTGLYFSDTNEVAFSSGGTLAWMVKKVGDDSRLYTTESNDYMECDNNAEAWSFYLDSAQEFELTKTRFNVPNVYSDTVASAANVNVDSNGRLRRDTSSLKYKEGWRHVELADVELPAPIRWESGGRARIGFGAEHVAAVLPEAAEDEYYDVRALVAVLSEKIKRLERELNGV